MIKFLAILLLLSTNSGLAKTKSAFSDVQISWSYQNFPLKIQIADVDDSKKKFISETKSFQKKEDSILKKIWTDSLVKAEHKASTAFALTIENTSDKDYYFFAVPHELNPHHASAGHYFECLCNGRVF